MKRRGFTIVELMMVIAIIAVLMGIITTAASSSIRQARIRKADTLCKMVQVGLATYHAQYGKWPVSVNQGSNYDDVNTVELSASQVRECVRKLVDEAKKGNPVMDISGLFVSRSQGERNSGAAYGLDFMQAVRGTKQSRKKMKSGEMYFGYPEERHGWFRRFKITYSIPGDSMTVSQQAADYNR